MSSPSSAPDPLNAVAEEFVARYRRGERPALTEYSDRHPELAEQIRALFPALVLMEQEGSVASPATGPDLRRATDGSPVPRQLGEYRILREVGRGGMGVVYEAVQESLGRHVALKVLPGYGLASPTHLERFRREAKAAAKLHHTNIVPVFGVGEDHGVSYYAMQFIQGQGLDVVLHEVQRLRGRPEVPGLSSAVAVSVAQGLLTGRFTAAAAGPEQPPPVAGNPPAAGRSDAGVAGSRSELTSQPGMAYARSVARVGVQVAEALAYAHGQGILHRDIKPSNLLLDTQGIVWITDFGLAKAEGSDELTHPGDLVGTLRYMAPERFQGHSDARGDVYSLGVTLYELLTLQPAFADSNRARLIERVTHEEPPRPRQLDRRFPRDLETIVLKAMDKDPRRRYATAAALAEDLRRFLADRPVQARRTAQWERAWRWCRRNPVVASLLAAVLLLFLAGFAGVTWNYWQAEAARQELETKRQELDANLYRHRIALAYQELTAGHPHPGHAEELLEACPQELRGWEWHYLKRLWRSEPVVLREPGNTGVQSVAFSPDGAQVAAACGDGTVKVRDLMTGQVVTLRGHDKFVFSVAFSPTDGHRLASASADGTVRVWDWTTQNKVLELPGHEGSVVGVAYGVTFSPDGQWLAAGSDRGTVKVWDATTGQIHHALAGHELKASCVTFSPDGRLLASGSWLGTVRIWDAPTGRCLFTLGGHTHPVGGVAFSPDGRHLAAGYFDRLIEVWDTTTGERLRTLPGHTGLVLGLAFSPNGRRLASASEDRTVRLWDVPTGQEVLRLRGHTDVCQCLAFSPDGRRLASASEDQTIRFWDATPLQDNEGQELLTFREHTHEVWAVAISPEGTQVASAGLDPTVRVWSVTTGQVTRTFADIPGVVFSLAFSPDGRHLAAAGIDGGGPPPFVLKVWEAQTGRPMLTLREPREIYTLGYSPDGRWLALGLVDGTVKLRDARTGDELGPVGKHDRQLAMVGGLTFRPDGRRLAWASQDGRVSVWDVTPAQQFLRGGRAWLPVLGLWLQAGGSAPVPLVALGQLGLASGLETRLLQPVLTLRSSDAGFRSVAFSPDGQRLLTGSPEGKLTLWQAETGREIHSIPGRPSEDYVPVAFDPLGRWVASAGGDCTVRVWDATTRERLHTFRGHQGAIRPLAVSRDGRFLVTGSTDKTVKVWDLTALEKRLAPASDRKEFGP
jgi:WD40 repeat protein/serine/threonine protein kinase